MRLSGSDLKVFRSALKEAFPARTNRLRIVVANADIGIDFEEYLDPNFDSRIQTLLEDVAGQCRLTKLFKAAAEEAPDNQELDEIKRYVETYIKTVSPLLTRNDGHEVEKQLEKVLFSSVGFQNVGDWLTKLNRFRRSVCRIEPQPRQIGFDGYATGFLVGKDAILTNDHVADFWDNPARAAKIKVRFDCEYDAQGAVIDGKTYDLATDYQILRSPIRELDFALLRLKGNPADDMIDGDLRTHLLPCNCDIVENSPLLILQHPMGEPMKLAFGAAVRHDNVDANRVNYSVNTQPGSSGSPVFTQDLKLAALHRQGNSDFNSGVLMKSLFAFWNREAHVEKLRQAGLGHLVGNPAAVPSVSPSKPTGLESMEVERVKDDPPPRPNLKNAFVIQSIGKPGSATRERSDRMMRELIGPACDAAGFNPERADKYPKETITEPIISALFGHPLVVADLGNLNSLSANVLIEVGFRISTGKPIVFLADAPLPDALPLHLSNRRIIPVDPANMEASQAELQKQLLEFQVRTEDRGWHSEHVYVDWRLIRKEKKGVYSEANVKAAEFYGCNDVDQIIGHDVEEVDNRLYSFMDDDHKEAFLAEQETIINGITASVMMGRPFNSHATVPLIFSRHPSDKYNETVHLPVIVNYKYDESSDSIVFRTVYLHIDRWCASDLADRVTANRKIPDLFRESRNYEHDFFLCFDSADFQQAMQLQMILSRYSFRVWWPGIDYTARRDRAIANQKLLAGLAKSRIAAVVIGANGRGRWGAGELDEALYKHCAMRKPLLLIVLPTAEDVDPDNCLGDRYAEVVTDPLHLMWPDNDDSVASLIRGSSTSLLERIVTELAKLLRNL